MGFRLIEIIATIILNVIHYTYADHILPCNMSSLEPCPGHNQMCNKNECVCVPNTVRVGDECEVPGSGGAGATAVVGTIFTLALVTCGLILVIRKYNLIDYIQRKINLRRNNDIIYEDVMIGQDDPPLSP